MLMGLFRCDCPALPIAVVENHYSGRFLVKRQSRQAFFPQREAPCECFCCHMHQSPRRMTMHPHLAAMPLKRTPLARGKRALRALSIVGWFSPLPWLESGANSVALPVCHLALVAARAPLAALGEDAQSDSTLATTPDGPRGVGHAGQWPRCGVPELRCHDGASDSPGCLK